jgi:hypothetical protein
MPYNLRFSDQSKIETVYVPDMPPGVNTLDTSLTFIGKNYPNYVEKIAQNFLNLLENFASPIPPINPIEGQLWYDTSDPFSKVLRIMDGTADNARWPLASGIYQQGSDPRSSPSAALKVGDIWVDTSNNQLKIYNSNDWTVIGPLVSSGTSKTGIEPDEILDTQNNSRFVIKNFINGEVVSIIANATFTPKVVISGFSILRPGINLSSNNSILLNGIASTSLALDVSGRRFTADKFLRKDDTSGQIITGRIWFQTPVNQTNYLARDGIVINTTLNSDFIQLLKLSSDAVLLNNTVGGKIVFKTRSSQSAGLTNTLILDNKSVAINTVTDTNYALSINGNLKVSGNLDLISTASFTNVEVDNTFKVSDVLNVSQDYTTITNLVTLGTTSSSGLILLPGNHNSYDIGTPSVYFRNLYVSYIGAVGTGTVIHGNITGSSNGLLKSTQFKLTGDIESNTINFNGTGTSATFVTNITSAGIKSITPVGSIIAFSTSTSPSGWLLCDGSAISTSTYDELFEVIGYSYGSSGEDFKIPDMVSITTATGGFPIHYIIKY